MFLQEGVFTPLENPAIYPSGNEYPMGVTNRVNQKGIYYIIKRND